MEIGYISWQNPSPPPPPTIPNLPPLLCDKKTQDPIEAKHHGPRPHELLPGAATRSNCCLCIICFIANLRFLWLGGIDQIVSSWGFQKNGLSWRAMIWSLILHEQITWMLQKCYVKFSECSRKCYAYFDLCCGIKVFWIMPSMFCLKFSSVFGFPDEKSKMPWLL